MIFSIEFLQVCNKQKGAGADTGTGIATAPAGNLISAPAPRPQHRF
jgi:hypothetical protein